MAVLLAVTIASGAAAAPPLFRDGAVADSPDGSSIPAALRLRVVEVDFDLLRQQPSTLRLNLFPDVDVVAAATEIHHRSSGSLLWKGTIGADGTAQILVNAASIAASVRVGGASFEVQSLNGVHVVFEADPSAPLDPNDVVTQGEALVRQAAAALPFARSAGAEAVVDLLLLYTSRLDQDQSVNDIQALAELRVEDMNEIFANSLIPARMRLVHVGRVVDDESGFSTPGGGGAVNPLFNTDDGRMDEAHVLRDVYAADMVQLWSRFLASGIAGIAHSITIGEREPFSVVHYTGTTRIVAHELGHSMGCDHDRANAFYPVTPTRYNFGYELYGLSGGPSHGDVMSYRGEMLRQYSTPDVIFDGVPTGIAYPDPNGQAADCARAIRENMPALASYRDAAELVPGTVLTLIDNGQIEIVASSQYGGEPEILFQDPYVLTPGAFAIAASDDGSTFFLLDVNPSPGHTLIRVDVATGVGAQLGSTLPFDTVGGLTMGADGFLYDAAPGSSCVTQPGAILKIDSQTGAIVGSWQGNEICMPAAVILEPNGTLLVAEPCHAAGCTNSGTLVRIRQNDGVQTVVASDPLLNAPEAMASTSDGNVVLVTRNSAGRGRLVRVDVGTGAVALLTQLFEDYYGGAVVGSDDDVWIAAGAGLWRFDSETSSLALVPVSNAQGAIAVTTVTPRVPACSDHLDQDGDGAIDFPADSGCRSLADRSETFDCADGIDDDGDGLTDYPSDPGCASAADPDEHSTAICDDGIDQDGDDVADFPADPGCSDLADTSERSAALACDDEVDNDGDNRSDFPNDAGCTGPADPSEREPSRICDDGLDNDGDGRIDAPADPGCTNGDDPSEYGTRACDDGVDNDGDGAVDTGDAGCTGLTDRSEEYDCQDGLENDLDGLIDHPDDPGCQFATSPNENPQCNNSFDDDQDGTADYDGGRLGYPPDPQCANKPYRDKESPDCGLGFEAAPFLVALRFLRFRKRTPSRAGSLRSS